MKGKAACSAKVYPYKLGEQASPVLNGQPHKGPNAIELQVGPKASIDPAWNQAKRVYL